MRAVLAAAAAVVLGAALPAPVQAQAAGSVALQFDQGYVTLLAASATLRAVLDEWGRLGGATIAGGDRLTAPR